MRRTIPYVVAVVATVVVVFGVMVGVGIGQTPVIHGGSPSDVYALREPEQEGCAPGRVTIDGVSIMPLQIELTAPSHVLVSFSFDVAALASHEKVSLSPRLDGSSDDFQWLFFGNSREGAPGSVTSVFPDQEVGTHYVDIYAEVQGPHGYPGRLDASLGTCTLTVFVIPAA